MAKLASICLGNGKKRLQSASGYLNNPYKNSQTAPTTTHGRSNQQASAEMTPLRPQGDSVAVTLADTPWAKGLSQRLRTHHSRISFSPGQYFKAYAKQRQWRKKWHAPRLFTHIHLSDGCTYPCGCQLSGFSHAQSRSATGTFLTVLNHE